MMTLCGDANTHRVDVEGISPNVEDMLRAWMIRARSVKGEADRQRERERAQTQARFSVSRARARARTHMMGAVRV